MLLTARIAALAAFACFAAVVAAQTSPPATTSSQAATRDTSFIDSEGTAHVTRVVPVPKDLSLEAQKSLATVETDDDPPSRPPKTGNRKSA
jgi:epsilon-lactone hydrolase